jgi:hypothetical protein
MFEELGIALALPAGIFSVRQPWIVGTSTSPAHPAADTIATALTKTTGDDWLGLISEDCCDARFTLERVRDGLSLSASFPTYQNNARQWHFHAGTVNVPGNGKVSLYNYRRGDEVTPRANIAATKHPAQIAADITRRILPPTDELIARAITHDAATTLREAWLDRTHKELVRACPLKLEAPNHDRRERGGSLEIRHWGKPYVTANLSTYSQEVKLTLDDLTPELAARILALLPQPNPEPQED